MQAELLAHGSYVSPASTSFRDTPAAPRLAQVVAVTACGAI